MAHHEWYFKIVQNTKEHKAVSGILDNFEILRASITAKHHIQVMLLFVYNGRLEIYSNAQKTSIHHSWKNKHRLLHSLQSFYISEKEKKDRQFFAKPLQTIEGQQHSSMKEIFKSQCLWSETTNEDKERASFSQCLIAALLKNTQRQHHCLSSPDSHKSGGVLFGKLESEFGYATWANHTHFWKFRQRIKSDIRPVLLSFLFENVIVKTLFSAQDLQTFIYMFVALTVFCLLLFWQAFQFPHLKHPGILPPIFLKTKAIR